MIQDHDGAPETRKFLVLAVLLLIFAMCDTATAQSKRVLLLHSFGRDFSPWAEFTRDFREELDQKSPAKIEFYDASLATDRFGAGQDEGPFVEYLRSLFDARHLDLVVAIGAPAARFVQRHRQQLFPSTPMLLTGVEQRRVPLTSLGTNDTLAATSNNYASVIENILHTLPDTTDIAVVIGKSPIEQYWLEQIRFAVQPYTNRIRFTWFNDLSLDEILKRAGAMPSGSAIFYFSLSVDAADVSHEGGKPFASLRAIANAPIFSYIDTNFGKGIVGGQLISVHDAAQQAASTALRILSGELPRDIKTPPTEHGTPKYDWRELRRWNISESRLPSGSEIHFRQPDIWEQYRWQLSTISAVVLFQAAMIGWLLFERQRRHRAEFESRGRLQEIIHLNRTAAAGVLSASFSHELNQPLGAILSNTEAAELLLTASPPDVAQVMEILADIRRDDQRAGEIIKHLGGLLRKKSRAELQEFDLNDAIRTALNLLDHEASSRGVVLDFNHGPAALPVLADPVHLQQVILNLVLNAMDAMLNCVPGSRKMTLGTARIGPTEVKVSVADTGPGIPEDKLKHVFDTFFTTKPQGTGLGLSIARTIIETYGGSIWAENKIDGGAVFRFVLPLAKIQAV